MLKKTELREAVYDWVRACPEEQNLVFRMRIDSLSKTFRMSAPSVGTHRTSRDTCTMHVRPSVGMRKEGTSLSGRPESVESASGYSRFQEPEAMPEITRKRVGELQRGVMKILMDHPDGFPAKDVLQRLEKE